MNLKRLAQSNPQAQLDTLLEVRRLAANTTLPAIAWPRIPQPPASPPAVMQARPRPVPKDIAGTRAND
jgi:hypothetical protein